MLFPVYARVQVYVSSVIIKKIMTDIMRPHHPILECVSVFSAYSLVTLHIAVNVLDITFYI